MSRTLVAIFAFVFVVTGHCSAFAQSAIERAFVAKSQLASEIWTRHDPASIVEINHDAWDAFLAKFVSTDSNGINRVAYSKVTKNDLVQLDNYLSRLQSTDVTTLNRNEQYAFWLNLYNATTVRVILKHHPIKSILDVKSNLLDFKGPFNDRVAKVLDHDLTLDTIESGIVRPIWNDPRLHYAFNCGAVSCPNLQAKAFRGKLINQQLDEAARSFVNDPRGVRLKNGKIIASKIFSWYREDFGTDEKSILGHIRLFASDDLKTALAGKSKISSYEYDWSLNQ